MQHCIISLINRLFFEFSPIFSKNDIFNKKLGYQEIDLLKVTLNPSLFMLTSFNTSNIVSIFFSI